MTVEQNGGAQIAADHKLSLVFQLQLLLVHFCNLERGLAKAALQKLLFIFQIYLSCRFCLSCLSTMGVSLSQSLVKSHKRSLASLLILLATLPPGPG